MVTGNGPGPQSEQMRLASSGMPRWVSRAVGTAKNHAFIDGNKRTAFQVMYVFLGLNGYRVVAPEAAVVALMVDVATGVIDEDSLTPWCRTNVVAR